MIEKRINALKWNEIEDNIERLGFSSIPALLTPVECAELVRRYPVEEDYRSVINMKRYRFGEGEYKYYSAPLPSIITALRESFYPYLARIANSWMERLKQSNQYPDSLPEFLSLCHATEQNKPTPLILKYEQGGFNCLHQDLYGEIYFPFQVLILLSEETSFEGGEFMMVEQIPRVQSRGHVISLSQGEGVIFPTQFRPVLGQRGYYRTNLKHGVSTLTSGIRYSLGIIFRDAK